MAEKFQLVSIGDSTHDVFMQLDSASVLCDIVPDKCLLCLTWTEKIPANKITHVPGAGSAANVAIGAVRLGLNSAIYTHVGDDLSGKGILKVLEKEKVDTSFVHIDKDKPSNFSVVLNYGPERTIVVRQESRRYNLPNNIRAGWFYYSSIATPPARFHEQIIHSIKGQDTKLVFQPGAYQLKAGKKKLESILKQAEVIILNKEEAQLLAKSTTKDIKILMKSLKSLGSRIVVVTDGPKGAYAFDGETYYFQDIFPVRVVERTGAGDGFSIGFVGALMEDLPIRQALLWGAANSTSVVQHIGAQKGLLTQAGIEKYINRFKSIGPIII